MAENATASATWSAELTGSPAATIGVAKSCERSFVMVAAGATALIEISERYNVMRRQRMRPTSCVERY